MEDDTFRMFADARDLCAQSARYCEENRTRIASVSRRVQSSIERLQRSTACLENAFKRLVGPGR